ncbi:peptide ABC transporter substrate-binding protein [Chlamydia caviae]|uniref:Peptide ABC transporter, periplasmic binding protein, putative n=1 Tax=Chlamydia caviae (strain ATCC VR-813 / DSM 19441 / 03DC25 / GPIC) TaxID=227941 RepID=Q822S9_CHLCV|nr:peptide ABC transporter substrate-binding protein [Chlamydia caviae]AAP05342.1 peptide ABC transporter, periplasmic binding protein, putative [Chlamydia caviae GPIC]
MTNRFRKYYAACFLSLASVFLISCHQQSSQDIGKSLRIGMSYDPISLDPRCTYLKKDISLAKALYEGLVREHISKDHVILGMAKDYTVSQEGCVYTFNLRDTQWSNGDPVTAYDFEESIKQIHTKNLPISYHNLLYIIKNSKAIIEDNLPVEQLGVKALDVNTLEITLEHPSSNFIEMVSHPLFFPVHTSLREYYKNPQIKPVYISNGPFILSDFQPQKHLTMKKNPHYYDVEKVKIDTLIFKVMSDAHTAAKFFKNNLIDILGNPWISKIPHEMLHNTPDEIKHVYSVCSTSILIYNLDMPVLQNKALRKALAYAIDKESLIPLLNSARIANSFLPPELSEVRNQAALSKEQREEKAREYLKEAKTTLSEKDLAELSLIYPQESSVFSLVVQELQQQFKNVLGMHIPIQGVEYFCFLEKRNKGDFYLSVGGWIAEYLNARNFLTVLGNPENKETSHQLGKWNNKQFDQILSKYHTHTFTKEDQILAEALIEDELPVFPMYHFNYIYIAQPQVNNLYASPLGHVDLKEVELLPLT